MKNTLTTAPATVLIHGFNGSPADLEYLHRYLSDRGMVVYSLKLNGHAGSRAEMAQHDARSWLAGVMRDVEAILTRHDKLNLVGFSMGGLLAVNLLERFQAEKVVFVNTPVYFWNARQIMQNICQDLKAGKYSNLKYYFCASHSAPMVALFNFLRLLWQTKPKFKNVATKILILQNKDDDTVQPRSALYIQNKLKGPARLVWFETGGHKMFVHDRKAEAAKVVHAFLQ